jgi:hypothetical protein
MRNVTQALIQVARTGVRKGKIKDKYTQRWKWLFRTREMIKSAKRSGEW